ncbi:MAG: GyrI-like domain-containing protein [Bacteroidota bacterium]
MIDKNDLKFGLFTDKKLIGKRLKMSLSNDRTYELWHDFMPRRNEITNKKNSDLICMQVYDPTLDFNDFSPETEFEKWAAIEVSDFDAVPEGMETYTIKAGLFVLFTFKGTQLEFSDLYRYIITKWLPTTEFKLDQREHFQILGEKYKNNDPNSEEKVFIPLWVHGDTTLDDLLGMCFNKKTMDNLILTANLYHL